MDFLLHLSGASADMLRVPWFTNPSSQLIVFPSTSHKSSSWRNNKRKTVNSCFSLSFFSPTTSEIPLPASDFALSFAQQNSTTCHLQLPSVLRRCPLVFPAPLVPICGPALCCSSHSCGAATRRRRRRNARRNGPWSWAAAAAQEGSWQQRMVHRCCRMDEGLECR